MIGLFNSIEEIMNGGIIDKFKSFVKMYPDVKKWFICSDYCLGDKQKSNNVITFVVYPYIFEFKEWNCYIESMQQTDLKHCRTVSDEFCAFTKAGYCFCFNFILEKESFIDKWRDKETLNYLIEEYLKLTKAWQITTPSKKEIYVKMNRKLQKLKEEMKRKTFNYRLLGRIVGITFLAAYLKFIMCKEIMNLELFSWLSDKDAITDWMDGIYLTFYHITAHCLLENNLPAYQNQRPMELALDNVKENMFYDSLNRVADFICGAIVDYDYEMGSVSGTKQKVLMETVISDNDYLAILYFSKNKILQVVHRKDDRN